MPAQNISIVPDGKICDYVDGKFRNDTPEEYVRQTIEKRLVNEHKYLREQIGVEFTLQAGSNKPRADLVVWEKDAQKKQETIKIIIECKNQSVKADNVKEGLEQLKSYMSVCPNCTWGMWTNSLQKYVFNKYTDDAGHIVFKECNDIPPASGDIDSIDRPTWQTLKNASDDNLLFVFRACHNHIYANEGLQKHDAFFEFLKVIFCKIEDEQGAPNPFEFYVTSGERSNPDGHLTVQKRIAAIFDKVKGRQTKIFAPNEKINLSPRTLAYLVGELQGYSLLNTQIDVKGKAYEEIVGSNLRGDRGEFFTPRNVMKMAVQMINPEKEERILDSSCGTGGFIVMALTHVMEKLEIDFSKTFGKPKSEWNANEHLMFRNRVADIARRFYFGFDISPELAKATKMNMVMNNDGSGNVFQVNSLLPPHEWPSEFKIGLAEALNVKTEDITNHKSIGFFNVIVTNPPFGSKIQISGDEILGQYDLAHIWQRDKVTGAYIMTKRLQSSVPPEILFIERCTQLLMPNGRMAIVLPDAILNAPGLEYVRTWILQNHRIVASIDLHADTFQPHNGTQTSILILQKKTEKERMQEQVANTMPDYPIFMTMVERIGHDRRGNPIFLRDDDGNEILDDGKKIIDDQTIYVPAAFAEWKKQEGIQW